MTTWREEVDHFLHEMIRLEGRGDYKWQEHCSECRQGSPEFRCCDCFTDELLCKYCIVGIHKRNPLHRIEVRTVYSCIRSFNLQWYRNGPIQAFSSQ